MQYEKCLTCPAIPEGKCSGPYYTSMTTKDLVQWLIKYQKINGITNADLAEKSGIPKGTIDGIKYREDVRHDTVRPLIVAAIELSGGTWGITPCENGTLDGKEIQELERRLAEREEKADLFKSMLADAKAENRSLKRTVRILSGILLVVLLAFIASLIVDKLNGSLGFFWR